MRTWNHLYHLFTQHKTGDEHTTLIRKLLGHWGLYSLTGYSKWGLALFLFRSARDVKQALDADAHAPGKPAR